jgi:hypothetical protein
MKNACLVLFLILSAAGSALGQSIANQLTVAKCSFQFYAGPTELEVLDQMVTTRSVQNSNPELKTFGRAYFIEVEYKGDEMEMNNALIEFLDENKRPLHAFRVEDASQYMKVNTLGHRPNPRVRYIAISLEGIPLRLLDDVISIRISK